jgi:uncharacterized YkwD family protein/spore coat assembly protein SafA
MRKIKTALPLLLVFMFLNFLAPPVEAQDKMETYKVVKGDSLWKIAVRYEIGVDEIIQANPQFKNPNLIYPNQIVNIPNIDSVKGVESEVLALVNKERAKAGIAPLEMDWELQRVARTKSCDMAENNYFSHNSPEYGSPFDMMQAFGIKYKTAGENIASGQRNASEVMNSWMNSSGHRANILKGSFTHIGIGYCQGGQSGTYWTQQFIGK